MSTYSFPKSKRHFLEGAILFLFLLFALVVWGSFASDDFDADGRDLLIWLFSVCTLILLILYVKISTYKLIVDERSIRSCGLRRVHEMQLQNVRGIKFERNSIIFVPANLAERPIRVRASIERFDELCNWAMQRYELLSSKKVFSDRDEILRNPQFGNTEEERLLSLGNAVKRARTINIISVIVGLSLIFIPIFARIQVALCILLPLAAILCVRMSKGLVRFDERKNSAYPSVFIALLFPSVGMLLRSVIDFSVFSYNGFWVPWLAMLLAMSVLMATSLEFRGRYHRGGTYASMLGMLFIAGMYAYGVVLETNAIFSKGKSAHYKALVLSKRVSYHKNSRNYVLKLSEWGPQRTSDDVSVSEQIYDGVEPSDSVEVQFRKGAFGIEYFRVRFAD